MREPAVVPEYEFKGHSTFSYFNGCFTVSNSFMNSTYSFQLTDISPFEVSLDVYKQLANNVDNRIVFLVIILIQQLSRMYAIDHVVYIESLSHRKNL